MTQVRNQLNAATLPKSREKNTLPSMTIPDQSLTIPQIIDRYTRGLPVYANSREPVYNGDTELPNLKTMDLSEIQELREFAQHQVQQQKERIQKESEQKRKKEQEEFLQWKEQKAQSNNQSNQGTNATQTGEAESTNKSQE